MYPYLLEFHPFVIFTSQNFLPRLENEIEARYYKHYTRRDNRRSLLEDALNLTLMLGPLNRLDINSFLYLEINVNRFDIKIPFPIKETFHAIY